MPENKYYPTSNPNHIDSLQTLTDVQGFLNTFKFYNTITVNDSLKFANKHDMDACDSLHIKPWFKADLDSNGWSDLVVICGASDRQEHQVICILDSGQNHFFYKYLNRMWFDNIILPYYNKNGFFLYKEIGNYDNESKKRIITPQTTKLVFTFGDFVEYNPNPFQYDIEKIDYETDGCFGDCPIYSLTINKDGKIIYDAQNLFLRGKEGTFKGSLDTTNYNRIFGLLNYIDFPNLSDKYSVRWTDDAGCKLTITYNNGKKKIIDDYGMIGTYGLARLYEMMDSLRTNQQWTEIKK